MILVNLAEFRLLNKISFAEIIKKVCKNWLINNFIINIKINLIIFIIISLGIGIANHFKKSIVIY